MQTESLQMVLGELKTSLTTKTLLDNNQPVAKTESAELGEYHYLTQQQVAYKHHPTMSGETQTILVSASDEHINIQENYNLIPKP